MAKTHRTAQISHGSSQRILDISDKSLKIDRTFYYHINRRPSRLRESQKRNELDKILKALVKAEFNYRPKYHYKIEKSGDRTKKKTDSDRCRAQYAKDIDKEVYVELIYKA